VIAILWIAFSDAVVTYLKLPPAVMTIKGIVFVFVTASLLYFTIRRLVQAVQLTSQERDETARLYRTVVEASNEGICLLDESGRISFLNGRLAAMLGRPAEELQGKRFQDFIEEPDVLAQRGAQQSNTHECRLRTDSDRKPWVLISRHPVLNDAGEVVQWVGTVIDITERKQAEEALRRSNRELRAISNCNQVLLRATDEQSLVQEICRIVCEEAGYRMAWVGYAEHDEAKSVRPVAWAGAEERYLANLGITWADTERGCGPTGTAIRSGNTCCIQDFATDPRVAPWRESALQKGFRSAIALPLKDEQANAFGSLAVHCAQPNAFTLEEIRLLEELAGDLAFGIVTLRSRAAREQAEQEVALLSFALDKGQEAAFLIDDTARFHYVNEEACRLLGYTRAKLLGLGIADIDPEFPLERWSDHWRNLKAQRSRTFESRHRTRDGRIFPVEISTNYFEYGGRAYHLALVRDITERKRAEEALRESEAYLADAQRLSHTGSWAFDVASDKYVYASEECLRIFELDAQKGLPTREAISRLIHPEDWDRVNGDFEKSLREKVDISSEFRIALPSGTAKHVQAIRHPVLNDAGDVVKLVGTVIDITERKRAEEEVRNTAAQWQATFDAVQDLVLLLDKDFRILRANRAAAEFLGLPFDKIVGGHCYDLIHGTCTPPAGCPLAKMRQSRRHEEEEVLARKGGPWLSVSVDPVFDQNGELTHAVHVARDITDRKRAEDALRRSEATLAEGQRLSHTGSWAWSPVTLQPLYWSEEMFRIYGLNPQEGVPTAETLWQRIHPEDRDRFRELQMKVAQRGLDYEHYHRIVLPDGTVKHIHAIGHPVLDENGQVAEYVGTAMDVTERKRAEDELRKHREHLEDLVKQRTEELAVLNQLVYGSLESGEVGALWIDFKEADTLHALDNTAGMLGLEPDPTGEKTYKLSNWTNLLADTAVAFPDYAPIIEEARERLLGAISGKYKNYRAVCPLAMPDGSLKWIDARAEIAKRDDYGQALLMTGTLIDITRLKQAEAELAEAKAWAEAANRAKSTFLANMSHELRTPLNAVLGFSRLLKNDPDVTPPQRETLDVIVRSGEHLLNLINNVLDMAKIESGRVVLKESEVDLNQLLHEMQSLMGVGAVEKGLRFALEHDPDLPRFVAVDAGKLRQVLLNLLGNAIKYTDSGGVKLRARLASIQGSEKAKVRFEVEDSGPGISQEDCQRIFFPFVQLGDQAPAQAGTGLGLAICKQYVELMGGQIGVTNKPGKGSVFNFEIPVRVLPSVAERDEVKHRRILGLAEGQPRHRLLIVEDQPENRLLLRRLLDPLGFELREAANGQEAVALFEQWHPDLIWMDIRMPVMDGLEAVRRIRATQAGADTKIIALTAHALEEEREPIMAAGCDDLVRKPFREQELFGALARHLRLKFIYEKAPRQESTPEAAGLAVRPEQLDALPAELLRDLRQAVIELDTARTQAIIEQVTERDASLGRALNTLATRLDYKRLLKLLEKEHPETGQMI
jgi:PAS domain S-box-containing protein